MSSIDSTLNERGNRYGQFDGHARITQNIKAAMQDSPNWSRLAPDQKEALEMAAHKFGRILNGDPDYIDSWHDVIGYTRLVEQRLEQERGAKQPLAGDTTQSTTFGPLKEVKVDPMVQAVKRAAAQTTKERANPSETCDCPRCSFERELVRHFEAADIKVIRTDR